MSTDGMKNLEKLHVQKIERRIREIGKLVWSSQVDVTDVAVAETMDHVTLEEATKMKFKPVTGGFRWGKPWSTAWFRLRFEVPQSFKGYQVNLMFQSHGECIIFRDGLPVQGLDLNHEDYVLVDAAKGGEKFELFVEAGASDTFGKFETRTMDQPKLAIVLPELWKAWHDLKCLFEMVVKGNHWTGKEELSLPDDSTRRARIIFGLNKAVDLFDYQDISLESLSASAKKVSKAIKPLYDRKANASAQTIACMGHAHIDVAWLWPLAETKRKCGRTFSTVLDLMDRYPEFKFSQSQPHLYEFTRDTYPSLYERIKEKVKNGQWDPVGCAWVEMDCNISSGESLVRQFLFGTRFFKDEFDFETTCLWLPDVFGYSGALPQLLKRSGIDNFLTQKISWSQFTMFPHHSFYWEGIDGSSVLSHFLPADDYNAKLVASEVMTAARKYRQKDRSSIQASLFGFGDGGGGPTKDMLERMKRFKDTEGTPRLEPMAHREFFERLEKESSDLPTWVGELYLEYHRGTLTTQCDNKKYNRKCEFLLRDAELISAINLSTGGKYAQKELNEAWKTVLLNQFHDIIPGSSITKVYEDSDKDYERVLASGTAVKNDAINHLAKKVDTTGSGEPVLAVNSLSWQRDDVISVDAKTLIVAKNTNKDQTLIAVGTDGSETPAQVGFDGQLRFNGSLPSLGHSVFHIQKGSIEARPVIASEKVLENEFIKVKFNAKGAITSIFDKQAKREVIAEKSIGNEFVLFEDKPVDNDAWDVDIYYNDKLLERNGKLVSIELIETGAVRSVLRIKRTISKSTISQDIILYANSKRLDFDTTIEWGDEKDVLLKVAFPVNVRSDKARYEIQFGSVERPTHWNTPADFAKFEVPAQKWVDLSESNFGVAILNDSKYGHDVRDNVMRTTLLRAPKYPDPVADVNKTHKFTYSVLPHTGNFTTDVVPQSYQLNVPVSAIATDVHTGSIEAEVSNFAITGDNVIIETVKKAEDDKSIIVRFYEAFGQRGKRTFSTTLSVKKIIETDLMENEESELAMKNGSVTLSIKPFQIRTLKLVF